MSAATASVGKASALDTAQALLVLRYPLWLALEFLDRQCGVMGCPLSGSWMALCRVK